MKPRIGVDCDGVIANPNPSWVRFFNRADHEHVGIEEVAHPQSWAGVNAVCRDCFKAALESPEVTLDCDILPHISHALESLSFFGELIFITHRRQAVQEATLEWLEKHGIKKYFSEFIFKSKNKALIAQEYSVKYHIDDSPEVAQTFADHADEYPEAAKLVLIDRPYNKDAPAHIRVPSLAKASDYLIQCLP